MFWFPKKTFSNDIKNMPKNQNLKFNQKTKSHIWTKRVFQSTNADDSEPPVHESARRADESGSTAELGRGAESKVVARHAQGANFGEKHGIGAVGPLVEKVRK